MEAVIFDLGNVLVFHDNALLFRRMAERAGTDPRQLSALWDEFHGALGERINRGEFAGDSLRSLFCQRLGVEVSPWEFVDLFNCHFAPNLPMLQLAEQLVGKVKLYLLSNTNHVHAQYVLPRLPVLERFDGLLLSHELKRVKPDPRIFQEALRRADTAPERTAFFDDIPGYVEAARAEGMRAEVFQNPAQVAERLRALGGPTVFSPNG